jgi:hypothetical protein
VQRLTKETGASISLYFFYDLALNKFCAKIGLENQFTGSD